MPRDVNTARPENSLLPHREVDTSLLLYPQGISQHFYPRYILATGMAAETAISLVRQRYCRPDFDRSA
jgi:hypothetical protein